MITYFNLSWPDSERLMADTAPDYKEQRGMSPAQLRQNISMRVEGRDLHRLDGKQAGNFFENDGG
jgi:hypothetical protein